MLSDEQLARIFFAHGVGGHLTRRLSPYQITDLAHAIEREAIAEPVRLMRDIVDRFDAEDDCCCEIDAIRDYLGKMK